MPNRKLFVGSSKEAADYGALAQLISDLSKHLSTTVDVVSWQDTEWQNLESALKTLTESRTDFSYAVFLAWPDDTIEIRGDKFYCCRDNVIFEFGLFLSQLDRERTFLVAPKPGSKLPPDNLEYRIITDILGTFMAGSYTFTGTPPTAKFELDGLIQKIKNLEKVTALTPQAAKDELSRLIKGAKNEISKPGCPDAYYSGYLSNTFDHLCNLKAIATGRSVQEVAGDLLTFEDYEQDVCDLQQLADLQRRTVKNDLDKVWVFADSPLEFQPKKEFDELRKTIRENLLEGVKYMYFLTENEFHKLKLDSIITGSLPKADQETMKRNITFFLVDKKLFKTFFTLHFAKGQSNPTSVYMSALKEDRKKDVLLQIADPKHVERIRENIELLFGKDDK